MKENLTFILLCFCMLFSCNESPKTKPVTHTSGIPYILPSPLGWDSEMFPIPIKFAPGIPYKGTENIRFTPGWGKTGNKEYWSYAFLWSLEGTPAINADTIKAYLKLYYTGLINSNIEERKIPRDKIFETGTAIEKIKTGNEDAETFSGRVSMFDYMKQEPMTLNCIVHVRTCPGQTGLYVFHELSPRPFTDPVWKSLDELWTGFECK